MIRSSLFVACLALALGACASPENEAGGGWSLRRALADAIAPEGYTPGSGQVAPPSSHAMTIDRAYQGDASRQQAGLPSVMVSMVTIFGGRINVPVGGLLSGSDWRELGGVATATVAECETVAIPLQRADKGGAATVYATRINGVVYIAPMAAGPCQVPAGAQSYPGYGEFPLQVRDRIMGATIRVNAWGAQMHHPGRGW